MDPLIVQIKKETPEGQQSNKWGTELRPESDFLAPNLKSLPLVRADCRCDDVISNQKYTFGLCPVSDTELKPLESPNIWPIAFGLLSSLPENSSRNKCERIKGMFFIHNHPFNCTSLCK